MLVSSSFRFLLSVSGVPVSPGTGKVPTTAELKPVQTNTVPNAQKVCTFFLPSSGEVPVKGNE